MSLPIHVDAHSGYRANERPIRFWHGRLTNMDLPIVCSLTEAELRQRRREVLDVIRPEAIDVTALPNGYLYRFEANSELFAQVSKLVDLERQCCQFRTFTITVEPQQPIALRVYVA